MSDHAIEIICFTIIVVAAMIYFYALGKHVPSKKKKRIDHENDFFLVFPWK